MASRTIARKITLAKYFQGAPKLGDFQIVEEQLPVSIQDGEIKCRAEWLTVDPYMRAYSNGMKLNDTMPGQQVSRVVESRNPQFPEGTQVVGNFGWRDFTVFKPTEKQSFETLYKMPKMDGLKDSYALGCLGMPGITAYYGLTDILMGFKETPGKTLVVSSAAGAVGSLVGQLGVAKELNVLGFAGSEDKLKWLKEELGFHHAFNYKTTNANKILKEFAPKGVDYYFDNVGGEFAFHVMRNMNPFSRIALCGAITTYNKESGGPPLVPIDYYSLIYKQIRLEGFMVMRWANKWFEGIEQLKELIKQGKLKIRETQTDSFEKMPQAFIELLEGKNTGKAVIKA